MSASRNSARLAAAAAMLLLAGPAASQSGPPVNLLPGRQAPASPPPASPPPAAPTAAPAAAPTASPVAPPGAPASGIEMRALQPADPSGAGTLGPADGGFGPGLWAGLSRPLAEALLARLPVGAPSHAMASLSRRLLLTAAPAPAGPAGKDWLALRAERLAAAGMLADLNALLALAPSGTADPGLVRAKAQALLLSGEAPGACAQAPLLLERDPGAFALKLMAFCRQLAGDRAQVELYENLLRDGGHKDPLFARLMTALERPNAPGPDSFEGAGPLHFAMLRAADRKLPADAAEGAEPMALRAVAGSESAPATTRLAAAERAEAAGAIDADMLRRAYAAAQNAAGPAADFQAAQRETQPEARARAIAKALRTARKSGGYMTQARVHAPALAALEPQPGLAWFAAEAGRGLAAAGEIGRAYDWLALAQRTASPANPESAIAVVTLWPLLAVADPRARLQASPEILASWRAANDAADPGFRERAGLLYALLEALGQSVPEAEWAALAKGPLVEPAPAPTALVARGLARAREQGAAGPSALYALLAIGGNGPAGASAATMAEAVAALSKAKLDRDARALALEAMIARGF